MTPEVKKRIEQIQQGIVPDGYKKTKTDIVPADWKESPIGKYIREYTEKTTIPNQYPVLTSARTGLMLQTDYYSNRQVTTKDNVGYNVLPYGYITFRSRSDDGRFRFNENRIIERGIISYFYPVFSFSEEVCHEYMLYLLNFSIYRRMYPYAEGTAQQVLSLKKLGQLKYSLPLVAEQKKIAEILATQDKAIELQGRKIEELKRFKKGCLEKMFPRKGQKVPEKRFPGFTDDWEQRKFDEVFDCTVPNNTLSRAELSYNEGTVLNVHYGDVLIKYGSVLDVQKDDIPRIPHRCREDFNGALLQDGDVIIADTAEDETTGKACEIGNLQGGAIVSGLHTMVCRPRNRMALGYLGYYLNSNAYHHQLLPLMQGIKVLSLSRSNIQKTSVSYPIAVKEQQLIAYYFSQLDNLITLHQRKLDEMKKQKKALMQLLLTGIVRVKP